MVACYYCYDFLRPTLLWRRDNDLKMQGDKFCILCVSLVVIFPPKQPFVDKTADYIEAHFFTYWWNPSLSILRFWSDVCNPIKMDFTITAAGCSQRRWYSSRGFLPFSVHLQSLADNNRFLFADGGSAIWPAPEWIEWSWWSADGEAEGVNRDADEAVFAACMSVPGNESEKQVLPAVALSLVTPAVPPCQLSPHASNSSWS